MLRQRSIFSFFLAVLLVLGAFGLGVWFGYERRPDLERLEGILSAQTDKPPEVDFSPFWKTWRLLEERFASEDPIDRQALVWGAISGMVASLNDPYTVFFPPEEQKDFESEIKGEFGGIGAEIGMRKGVLVVIAPLEGTPADHAGLRAGDKIIKIDDTSTSELTLDEAVHLIRGLKGTSVTLTIFRNHENKAREITIVRDVIRIPVLKTEQKSNGIFVIKLFNFNEGSVLMFREAVRDFLRSGSDKLVLDLRNNPGGFLEASVEVASWFLPKGAVVAREAFYNKEEQVYRSAGFGALEQIPVAVLINQGSASASEILAGALREHGKATLIGEKTFGKGSVQQLEYVTNETSLKVTIARWLTPNGVSISKEGLAPDIEVAQEETAENEEPKSFFDLGDDDPAMARAIQYLLSGE